jgi:hypothetical protein
LIVLLKPENQRILPALDRAHEEALRLGVITSLDGAGVAMMFTLAGVLDSGTLKPADEVKYMNQLMNLLDKYGLSLYGRKEKPDVEVGDDPLERIRQYSTENSDHTDSSKPN